MFFNIECSTIAVKKSRSFEWLDIISAGVVLSHVCTIAAKDLIAYHLAHHTGTTTIHTSLILLVFRLKEKSPIPNDRYDKPFFPSTSAPHSPARSITSQNSPRNLVSETRKPRTAIALYQFNAHHPRYGCGICTFPLSSIPFINYYHMCTKN